MAKSDWVDGDTVHGSDMNTLGTEVAAATSANAVNAAALAGKQPLDSDLTTIAGISPANNDVLQRKSGAWTNRTPAQVKTDLALAKGDVGLGNVDNTADASKPVSTAAQTALDLKAPLASPTFTGTVAGVTKAHVGLGSVDNTADTAKPVSTAQQTALNLKANLASPTFTGTVAGVTKSHVGLGSVDNTADTAKPVSTAQQTALNLKANLASTAPVFTVSTFYGGTLGGSDDTACIQATLDACHDAGGGIVILPPNLGATRWKAQQIILPDGVHFKGSGWHSYALDDYTGSTKLQQLTGVNDDFIITHGAGNDTSDRFSVAFGISDMSLRGAAGSTDGHAISFRNAAGDELGPQDLTTIERIFGVAFAGSVIHSSRAVPLTCSSITGIGNGGYVVEVVETLDPTVGLASQVVLQNLSGDGNMGYGADDSGGVVYLKGIKNNYSPAVSIFGVKSEYRARETYWGFDGLVWGNYHAVVIEDCNCPISITGVSHLGHHPTKRCGNAIQIVGAAVPNLMWQSVNTRGLPTQSTGAEPVPVYDAVASRGSSSPHGVWGPKGFAVDSLQTPNGKALDFEAAPSSVNWFRLKPAAAGGVPFIQSVGESTDVHLGLTAQGAGGILWYQNSGDLQFVLDGGDSNVGVNFDVKGTGTLKADNVPVVTTTGTQTQTNKRITPRIGTVTSSATPTINTDNVDQFNITALAAAITSFTTNLSGTPTDGQLLDVRIKGDATPRAIAWGASFTGTLLTTTAASKTHLQRLKWDAAASKWAGYSADTSGY